MSRTTRNSDDPSARDADYRAFIERYPKYTDTSVIDDLRRAEFSRLDELDHVYLDYTGGGLYGESQIRDHMDLLLSNVLGNPHSANPSSQLATELTERCRCRVLDFFHASPAEYAVVFTANASHALKLVGESYPFSQGDRLLLTFDNHNSVNGIREYDRACGAITEYVPIFPPDLRVPDEVLDPFLEKAERGKHNLFAYPAQSNFSGVRHPLEWIERARGFGWDVLLDAAAYVPTNRFDLSRWHPDFVAISFYKMFGYPTGVGALLARWSALDKLRRPWFSGGTITVASVQADQHVLAPGAEAFEDGTLNYACLPAVERGLDFVDSVGVEIIHERVKCLTGWLIDRLGELKHRNGEPLVRIYGPIDTRLRGGTISMNFYAADGQYIDDRFIEARANEHNISLRSGCFCNPGAGEAALGLEREEIETCLADKTARMSLEQFRQCIDGKNTGAIRVSMGLATNFDDAHTLVNFAAGFCE